MEEGLSIYPDVIDLRAFYGERLGQVARRLLSAKLRAHWPSVAGDRLVGIGFATPYLAPFAAEAERTLAFMPAPQGVVNWPGDARNRACLVVDDALPLPDASVDRIIAVHSIEMAENARFLLRELWRVLAPGGRLLAVVPNRRGIWARVERTPFGYGRPFSGSQMAALMRDTQFTIAASSQALFAPPFGRNWLYRSGTGWERVGSVLWPAFAGVVIVEAVKQLYQGLPARPRGRLSPSFRPVLVPPAAAGHAGRIARDRPPS
ncbi:methyltransferase domain-containing protein [Prosthecomicrobium pneumaticum]|uniref:SAM-dependent methyltransferase n=1 Tax=Prosthecomicrobium pneumaticum TaxID=81895 RepID=A0A7W9FQK3_9HYPH|nr:SAM-dependent methyltransferase [Prosthecomicrobium pneumaticum]